MSEIRYGQTRVQVCEIVKKMLDKAGKKSPFPDTRPGQEWWEAFMKCRYLCEHPNNFRPFLKCWIIGNEILRNFYCYTICTVCTIVLHTFGIVMSLASLYVLNLKEC